MKKEKNKEVESEYCFNKKCCNCKLRRICFPKEFMSDKEKYEKYLEEKRKEK